MWLIHATVLVLVLPFTSTLLSSTVQRYRVFPWSSMLNTLEAASWPKRLPPTAGVTSSRLCHSTWISWWTKRDLGRFYSGFLPFSRATNCIPSFLHTHFIRFISFHQPLWWCNRRGRLTPLPLTDFQCRGLISYHASTRSCVRHELRMLFIYYKIFLVN